MLQAQALPHYYTLSAGLAATVADRWEFTVSGTNLTNQIGVTEENPRVAFGSGIPAPGTQLARSIDGREVMLQAKFKF
jgi:outer membrane receptor protein involved in Fe transport